MCGIVGITDAGSAARGLELVRRMNDALAHRGPDDEGAWADDRVAIGMRRLSIIDLSPGGHQPMWHGDHGLVFNGEIYNYRALRDDLARRGVAFRSGSDTEVLLQLLATDGLDAIERVEGMFAFCLVDRAAGRLHLVRDRLGKKPLYYRAGRGGLAFASEIKALLPGLAERPTVRPQSIADYLTFRYVPGPETIWEGIAKLPPAHHLEYDLTTGDIRTHRYWHSDVRADALDPTRDYEAEFAELFLGAVEKRLVAADVPVGVLLSGGLDSSAVAAAAVELGHQAFHTFSVAFDGGPDVDERPFARAVAAHVGSQHHEVVVSRDDFLAALPRLVEVTDEPLADLATIPLLAVSALARRDVKVVLSGEGADEVLAGYELGHTAAQLARLRRFSAVPGPLLALASRARPGDARLAALARGGYRGYLAERRSHMPHVWSDAEKAELWPAAQQLRASDARIAGWYADAPSPEPLDQHQQVQQGSWLVEDLLMKADKATMATSLELRVPFLDHALVEWGNRLPSEWKVGSAATGWTTKRILRSFAARRLPPAIIERPKLGFPVPAYGWLGPDLPPVRAMLDDGPLLDLFERPIMVRTVEQAAAGDLAAAHRAWALVVLDQWYRRWS
jgi:asparagine synthase (glutamine-hydrolysing)